MYLFNIFTSTINSDAWEFSLQLFLYLVFDHLLIWRPLYFSVVPLGISQWNVSALIKSVSNSDGGVLPNPAKDMAHENYPIYHHARPTPLHIHPNTFERKPLDTYLTEGSDSPESSVNLSPLAPSLSREESAPLTPISQHGNYDSRREPSSGPQRSSKSLGRSNVKGKADKDGDKEKRKRSRVNPEQLVHLERFFSIDRSPTALRRKEISELLGMQERQTQIWFQNRSDFIPTGIVWYWCYLGADVLKLSSWMGRRVVDPVPRPLQIRHLS